MHLKIIPKAEHIQLYPAVVLGDKIFPGAFRHKQAIFFLIGAEIVFLERFAMPNFGGQSGADNIFPRRAPLYQIRVIKSIHNLPLIRKYVFAPRANIVYGILIIIFQTGGIISGIVKKNRSTSTAFVATAALTAVLYFELVTVCTAFSSD